MGFPILVRWHLYILRRPPGCSPVLNFLPSAARVYTWRRTLIYKEMHRLSCLLFCTCSSGGMLQTCRIAYVKSPILSSQPIMVTFTRAIHKSQRMRFLITRLPATAMPFTSTQIFTSSAGCLARRHICTTSTQTLATDINLQQGQAITSTNTHRMSQRQAISHTPSTAIHSSAVGRARVGYGPHIHGKRTRKHFYTERLMPWRTQEEVTEMLKDNIVYQDGRSGLDVQ